MSLPLKDTYGTFNGKKCLVLLILFLWCIYIQLFLNKFYINLGVFLFTVIVNNGRSISPRLGDMLLIMDNALNNNVGG